MTVRRILGSISSFFAAATPWILFACLAAAMLFNPSRDTLGVAGAAFALALALASIIFSYARILKEGSPLRDELVFGGERLVNSAILFLSASILKYASFDVPNFVNREIYAVLRPNAPPPDPAFFDNSTLGNPIAFIAFLVFLFGLVYAQMGITILIAVMRYRARSRPHKNGYFDSFATYEQRLVDLEKRNQCAPPAAEKPQGTPPPPV